MRIWEKAGDFDPAKGSPIAWMATIARNRALDEVRRAKPLALEDMPENFEPAAEEVDPLARARAQRAAHGADALPVAARPGKASNRSARLLSRSKPRGSFQAFRASRPDDQDLAASQPLAAQGLSFVMSLSPDDDLGAAEFALGTLDAARTRDVCGAAPARARARRCDRRLGSAASRPWRRPCLQRSRRAISSRTSRRASTRGLSPSPSPRAPINPMSWT